MTTSNANITAGTSEIANILAALSSAHTSNVGNATPNTNAANTTTLPPSGPHSVLLGPPRAPIPQGSITTPPPVHPTTMTAKEAFALYNQTQNRQTAANTGLPGKPNAIENESVESYWTRQPGFESAGHLLNPNKTLDEDELWHYNDFLTQAQKFIAFRKGYYSNGQPDYTDASTKLKPLLTTPVSSLSQEEKKALAKEAVWQAGWVENNTVSMVTDLIKAKRGNVPDDFMQAHHFVCEVSDNLGFKQNWWSKTKRFTVQGVLTDPMSLVSLSTLGAGTVASTAGKAGIRSAFNAMTRTKLRASITLGAMEGAFDGALHSTASQNFKTSEYKNDDGITTKRQQEFSYQNLAAGTAISGAAGGGLGLAGHGIGHAVKHYKLGEKFNALIGRRPASVSDTPALNAGASTFKEAKHTSPATLDDSLALQTLKQKEDRQEAIAIFNALRDPKNQAITDKMARLALSGDPPSNTQGIPKKAIEDNLNAFLAHAQLTINANPVRSLDDLSQSTRNTLCTESTFLKPLQEFSFTRSVDNALAVHNKNFNFEQNLAAYQTLSVGNDKAIRARKDSIDYLLENENLGLKAIKDKYHAIKDMAPESLSPESLAFRNAYKDEIAKNPSNFLSSKANSTGPTSNADQKAYEAIAKAYAPVRRQERDIKLPELDTGYSRDMMGFFLLLQNRKTTKTGDALRIGPNLLPIDSRSNVRSAINSIDHILTKNDFFNKVEALDGKMKTLSSRLEGAGPNDPQTTNARTQIWQEIKDFARDNKDELGHKIQDLETLEQHVRGWATADTGRFRKGIAPKQKEVTLRHINSMKQMLMEYKNPQKDAGTEWRHIDDPQQQPENLKFAINRLRGEMVNSTRRITNKDPLTGQKAKYEENEDLARTIDAGFYIEGRRNNAENFANSDGNTESLIDKTLVGMADKGKEEGSSGSVVERSALGNVMATFGDLNLSGLSFQAIREFRWRSEAKNNAWNDTHLAETKNKLGLGNGPKDTRLQSYMDAISEASALNKRDGGGRPGYFGKSGAMGTSGVRWAQDMWIHKTFLFRIAYMAKGDKMISGPAQQMVWDKAGDLGNKGIKYITGMVKDIDPKTQKQRLDDNGKGMYKWGDSSSNHAFMGLGRIPYAVSPIAKMWNSTPAVLVRIPGRAITLPAALVAKASKEMALSFSNTAIILGSTFAGLGIAEIGTELALSNVTGEDYDIPLDLLPHTLNAPLAFGKASLTAMAEANRFILTNPLTGPFTEDSLLATSPSDSIEFIRDKALNTVSEGIYSHISNNHEISTYNNLGTRFKNLDHTGALADFTRYFETININEARLLNAPELEKNLQAVKNNIVAIQENFLTIQSKRETSRAEYERATQIHDAALAKKQNEIGTPEIRNANEKKWEAAAATLTIKKEAYNDAKTAFDTFAQSMITTQYGSAKMFSYAGQIKNLQEAAAGEISGTEFERIQNQLQAAQNAYENHADKVKDRIAYITQLNAPQKLITDPATIQKAATGSALTKAQKIAQQTNAVFGIPRRAGVQNSISSQASQAKQASTVPPENTGSFFPSITTIKKEVDKHISENFSANAEGIFDSLGKMWKTTTQAVKNSNSPLLGIGAAGFAALIGVKMLFSGGKQGPGFFSNLFSGGGKTLTFLAIGLAAWAGWKHFKGTGASPTNSSAQAPGYKANQPHIAMLHGQSATGGSHFASNDPQYTYANTNTSTHQGQNLQISDAQLNAQGSGQLPLLSAKGIAVRALHHDSPPDSTAQQILRIEGQPGEGYEAIRLGL